MLLDLLGLDLESQAKGETGSLNKTRDDMKWDLGDMFRSAITGVSKQDVIDEAASMVTEQINNKNSGTIGTILDQTGGTQLGLTNEGLQIQAGETETAYNQRLGQQSRLGQAIVEATASTPGFDASSITAGATPGSVLAGARKLTDQRDKDAKDQARGDILNQQNTINAQNERAQSFREHESSENRKERAHNEKMRMLERQDQRADRKAELLMNREMKMLDRQYMRERDERAEARADKNRKQQSIMMLVKGLTNLGQGFAL